MENKIIKFEKLTNTKNYKPIFNNKEKDEDYLDRFLSDIKALKVAKRVNKYNEIKNTKYFVGLYNEPSLGWDDDEDEFFYIVDEVGYYQKIEKFYNFLLEQAVIKRKKRLIVKIMDKCECDEDEEQSFKI